MDLGAFKKFAILAFGEELFAAEEMVVLAFGFARTR
jgi:hypothetical protein